VIDEVTAVRLAADAIAGKISPGDGAKVSVQCIGDVWHVEWKVPGDHGRGPDFEARVTIDGASGEVLSILAGS